MNCGIDFREFLQLLICIMRKQWQTLQECDNKFGACMFNLQRIGYALEDWLPYFLSCDVDTEEANLAATSSASCAGPKDTDDVPLAMAYIDNTTCLVEQRKVEMMLKGIRAIIKTTSALPTQERLSQMVFE